MNYQFLDTPIGTLRLVSKNNMLTKVEFEGQHQIQPDDVMCGDSALREASEQLEEYFAGRREKFDLSLSPGGTDFQQQVWSSLR